MLTIFTTLKARLPVARCLHSRIRFTFSPQVIDPAHEIDVRVVPPLGNRRRSSHYHRFSGDAGGSSLTSFCDDDIRSSVSQADSESTSTLTDIETHCIHGLFPATDHLTIRWATAGAGKLQEEDDIAAVFCDAIETDVEMKYSTGQQRAYQHTITVDAIVKGELRGAYCPGPDPVVYLPITLDDFGRLIDCQDMTIEESQGLQSWHFLDSGDVPRKHPLRTASDSTFASADSATDDAVSIDGDDLMTTKLPLSTVDTSMDISDDFYRKSTQRENSARRPPLRPSEIRRIVLYIDADRITPNVPFTFTLRCTLLVDAGPETSVQLPIFAAPTARRHRLRCQVSSNQEGLAPLDMDLAWRPSRSPTDPVNIKDSRSLSFQADIDPADYPRESHCFLRRLTQADDEAAYRADSTLRDELSSIDPGTPQPVYRPMPVYDPIILQEDTLANTAQIHLASLMLFLWQANHDAMPSYRAFGELFFRWPAAKSDAEIDEVDVWLQRVFGRADPLLHSASVNDCFVQPTCTDAVDSLCFHVRKGGGALVQRSTRGGTTDKVRLVFEFENVCPPAANHLIPNAKTTLRIPLPFFGQEVVRMDLSLHFSSECVLISAARALTSNFDVVQRTGTSGEIHLHKFGIPPLTQMDLILPLIPSSSQMQACRGRWRRRIAGMSILTLVAAAVLLFAMLSASLYQQESELELLHRKIEQLAMAANVDFRDGMWGTSESGEANNVSNMRHVPLTLDHAQQIPSSSDQDYDANHEGTGNVGIAKSVQSPRDGTAIPYAMQPIQPLIPLLGLQPHHILMLRTVLAWPLLAIGRGAVHVFSLFVLARI